MRTRVTPFAATLPLTFRRPAADTTPSRTSTEKSTSEGHAPRDVAICTLQLPSKAPPTAKAPVGESAATAKIVATARAELRANINLSFGENRDLADHLTNSQPIPHRGSNIAKNNRGGADKPDRR